MYSVNKSGHSDKKFFFSKNFQFTTMCYHSHKMLLMTHCVLYPPLLSPPFLFNPSYASFLWCPLMFLDVCKKLSHWSKTNFNNNNNNNNNNHLLCCRSAGKRFSGSPQSAIVHLLSTLILSGGLLQLSHSHSFTFNIQLQIHLELLVQLRPNSPPQHPLCLHCSALLFLFTQPSLSLCTLHMCTKNNTDSSCSHSFYISEDSLQHNPPVCVSCANHMFNNYTSWSSVPKLWNNQRMSWRSWIKCNWRSSI